MRWQIDTSWLSFSLPLSLDILHFQWTSNQALWDAICQSLMQAKYILLNANDRDDTVTTQSNLIVLLSLPKDCDSLDSQWIVLTIKPMCLLANPPLCLLNSFTQNCELIKLTKKVIDQAKPKMFTSDITMFKWTVFHLTWSVTYDQVRTFAYNCTHTISLIVVNETNTDFRL